MKRAIPIPGRISFTQDELLSIRQTVLESPSGRVNEFSKGCRLTGTVHSTQMPRWLKVVHDDCLVRLNALGKGVFRFNSAYTQSSLLFGKGSVGSHADYMTGLNLLTFVGGFHLDPNEGDNTQLLVTEGEFYAGGQSTTLELGQSLVFDDEEVHSWMHNACWIFTLFPVEKVPLPSQNV